MDDPFLVWLRTISPTWQWHWRHLAAVREHLARVTAGTCKRLALFMPPRHGKSEQTTVRYPLWRLESCPTFRACVGCYNQTFADRFGRKARRLAQGRVALSRDRLAAKEWETEAGGVYRSCGVGNPPTGEGFDLILIDDPIKSREEADSPAYRDRVWEWYTDDLYTRLEPGGAVVLIVTRWHEDDLWGRIRASEDGASWEALTLPAEAEANDPMGRPPGAALCPERYDLAALAAIRRVLGAASYAALYQQHPVPRGGGMFKREWFAGKVVGASPVERMQWVRYWDKAGTEGGGANSSGVLIGRSADGVFYVADVIRGQWSAGRREAVIEHTAGEDRQRRGRVEVWTEQEPGSGGKESAEATVRRLAGFVCHAERVTGSKESRAEPFAAQCEAGNVYLVRGDWNAAYLDELCVFPSGKFKDQVDASGGAFNKLAARPRWAELLPPTLDARTAAAKLPEGVFG